MADCAFDVLRSRFDSKNDKKVNGALAADAELDTGQDVGHRLPFVSRALRNGLELRLEPLEAFDAVVVREGDEIHPVAGIGRPACLNEALGDSRKPPGILLPERLNGSADVLPELLFAIERRVHVQVAPQPPGTWFRAGRARSHSVTSLLLDDSKPWALAPGIGHRREPGALGEVALLVHRGTSELDSTRLRPTVYLDLTALAVRSLEADFVVVAVTADIIRRPALAAL
ncbi:MAG TPA: hypothetical protein VNB06_10355 [Thermoanaerobaculia bacterium]|nr:hypothetical protein [Thermoanaerobaculia bacterium]